MNACHLPYLSLFRGCIILRRVRFFFIFSLNYQQGVTVYIDYKINFTNELKANLWVHFDLGKVHHLKGLTSPYIVSYLHFLNLNNIDCPQTFVFAEAGFDLTRIMFALFFSLPDLDACLLVYEIKTNASRLYLASYTYTVCGLLITS